MERQLLIRDLRKSLSRVRQALPLVQTRGGKKVRADVLVRRLFRRDFPLRVYWRYYTFRTWPGSVDFVIAGAMRSGTSALFAFIKQHPEICTSDRKEVHFFDKDDYFKTDNVNYRKYHAWFSPRERHKVVGEATPYYMSRRSGPARLATYNPEMKLIMILRDPIERAYSQWNKQRREGRESRTFWQALQTCRENPEDVHQGFLTASYVERGLYADQLERVWKVFPKSQTLVLRNEELRHQQQETLSRVFDFLNVSLFNCRAVNRRVSAYEAPMEEEARSYLREVFTPQVKALEDMLGWDCSDWLA